MKEKRVVITGAAHGIGRAIASEFARHEARLLLVDLDGDALERARVELVDSGASVLGAYQFDVGDRQAYAEFAGNLEIADVLVNNAGVVHNGPFVDISLTDWDWLYRTNLLGVVHGCHYLAPTMVERQRGHIVNIASAAGLMPLQGLTAYSATKHAVVGFSEALASELEPHGVGVSVICPAVVSTQIGKRMRFTRGLDPNSAHERVDRKTAASPLAPEHVARAVLNAVRQNRRQVIIGREAHLLELTNRLPRSISRRLVAWAEKRLR